MELHYLQFLQALRSLHQHACTRKVEGWEFGDLNFAKCFGALF